MGVGRPDPSKRNVSAMSAILVSQIVSYPGGGKSDVRPDRLLAVSGLVVSSESAEPIEWISASSAPARFGCGDWLALDLAPHTRSLSASSNDGSWSISGWLAWSSSDKYWNPSVKGELENGDDKVRTNGEPKPIVELWFELRGFSGMPKAGLTGIGIERELKLLLVITSLRLDLWSSSSSSSFKLSRCCCSLGR